MTAAFLVQSHMNLSLLLGDLRQEEIAADAAVVPASPWPRNIKESAATFGDPRQCPKTKLETWLRWLSLLVFLVLWRLFFWHLPRIGAPVSWQDIFQ